MSDLPDDEVKVYRVGKDELTRLTARVAELERLLRRWAEEEKAKVGFMNSIYRNDNLIEETERTLNRPSHKET